jgi:hypothetical protein
VAADAEVDLLPDKSFWQPGIVASVDVARLWGHRSGVNPSEAFPAAAPPGRINTTYKN